MSRILFVDDDRLILRGLRRQLHSCGVDWTLEFAPGGPEALEAIAARPFDVVVSDMQMPVVDGAAVLARVAETQPRAARLVLSGHADPERSRLASSCAHRHLDKPCTTGVLELEIQKALAMRELLDETGLAEMWCRPAGRVSGCEDILSGIAGKPRHLPPSVLELLEGDVGLWARSAAVLVAAHPDQLAAGASPADCASRVGVTTVLSVLLVVRFLQTFDGGSEEHWSEAGALGVGCCAVAREQGLPDEAVTECLMAGLLLPFVLRNRRLERRDLLAYLLPTWGLPPTLVAALTADDEAALVPAGPGPALAAVRLQRGDPAATLLARRLEDVGWGSRIAAWRELAAR